MYRLNELSRMVLITTDEVVKQATTRHTIDARVIETSIIIAEERFIRVALGNEFYAAIVAEKNLVITSGNIAAQQALIDAANPETTPKQLVAGDIVNASEYMSADSRALWNQFLWKLCAECVLFAALAESYVQFSATGAVHSAPTMSPMGNAGEVTPDLRSMKWSMDKKLSDRIDPLMEAMHLWLCRQREADTTKYPLYTKHCDCNHNGVPYKRKTDIVFGIYDHHRRDYLDRRDPNVHPDCDCDDI